MLSYAGKESPELMSCHLWPETSAAVADVSICSADKSQVASCQCNVSSLLGQVSSQYKQVASPKTQLKSQLKPEYLTQVHISAFKGHSRSMLMRVLQNMTSYYC